MRSSRRRVAGSRPAEAADRLIACHIWPNTSAGSPSAAEVAGSQPSARRPTRDIPAYERDTVHSDPSASLVAVTGHADVVAPWPPRSRHRHLRRTGRARGKCIAAPRIGRHLVAHLIAAAPARQVTELTASVLIQNGTVADLPDADGHVVTAEELCQLLARDARI
jgi:hypothetical protein